MMVNIYCLNKPFQKYRINSFINLYEYGLLLYFLKIAIMDGLDIAHYIITKVIIILTQ